MFGFRKRRRKKLLNKQLPTEWITFIERNVPYYLYLPLENQIELQGFVNVFLAEKNFEGCGGLEISDEIRVTIAAQACILLLGRETDFYPTLHSILVYPHAYVARVKTQQPNGTVFEGPEPRLGESWSHGSIVLAWDEVLHGASDIHNGQNLIFHEFAHQLDSESGAVEGVPILPKRSMYLAWARVLGHEYNALVKNISKHRPTLLDQYGATSPAEFFAVATECYFEKPKDLKQVHPKLYKQLKMFYQLDPAIIGACVKEREKM